MQIRLIVAGKPALAYAKTGVEEYMKRLSRGGTCELVVIKPGTSDDVSGRLLEASSGAIGLPWMSAAKRSAPADSRQKWRLWNQGAMSKPSHFSSARPMAITTS